MTAPTSVGEVGAAYAGIRERVTHLVRNLDDEARARTVPACPEWRVHDLVAHLAGVIEDVSVGRLEGAGSAIWTAAQVEARRERSLTEVLDEWDKVAPDIESIIDGFGRPGRQLVMDAVSHEHDLRNAIGVSGARDSDAVAIGVGWLLGAMTAAATAAGHPPLRLRTSDGREWQSHADDEPVATLTATPFELLRACSGRRTAEEIGGLHWDGDVDAVLPAFTFGPFAPCTVALGE